MSNPFKKAEKSAQWLRMAITGPSGSGKTYTALAVAHALGGRTAVIDSERGSAAKYAGDGIRASGFLRESFEFDHLDLEGRHEIKVYLRAIECAKDAGYRVLVLDSLSHAYEWLKDEVERIARAKYKGNTWAAWLDGTVFQKQLVNAILDYPGHVIATMRSRTEWVVEGKTPVRVGTKAIQKEGTEYEFDVILAMADGAGHVQKSRCAELADRTFTHPGREFAEELLRWLGTSPKASPLAPPLVAEASTDAPAGAPQKQPPERPRGVPQRRAV